MMAESRLLEVLEYIPNTDVDASLLLRLEKTEHRLLVVHLRDRAEQREEERLVCATVSSP
jgi:hypothetical protein